MTAEEDAWTHSKRRQKIPLSVWTAMQKQPATAFLALKYFPNL
jgi:hypothetical protein